MDASTEATPSGANRIHEAGVRYFLKPLVDLLEDESVTEIMVNGPDDIYVERAGQIEKVSARFANEAELMAAANNIAQFVGKSITEKEPLLDGRLPDGSRVCIVRSPISASGTSINIRRYLLRARSPEFLIEKNAITEEALEFLLLAVEARQNIIVSGGTGAGKTTLLNILSTAFRDDERILLIEDTRELQVPKQHVIQMEARPPDRFGEGEVNVRDLFVTALRMRPDRIVVGEVRRGEALDMIQAMTSGHRGSLTTLHADTPSQACGRLETMAMMANLGLPLAALRRQISLAMDLIVQVSRRPDGRRLITHISEVGLDDRTNEYQVRHLFQMSRDGEPHLVWSGERPALAEELSWRGLQHRVDRTRRLFEAQGGAR